MGKYSRYTVTFRMVVINYMQNIENWVSSSNIYLENSGLLHMTRCCVSGFIHDRISVLLGLLDSEDEGTIFL